MRSVAAILALAFCVLTAAARAGTPGVFQGTVVEAGDSRDGGWLYVQGRNGSVRRVGVQGAEFVYGDDVPKAEREAKVPRQLPPGTIVQVTAEAGPQGEWRASRVEIVQIASQPK